MKKRTVSFALTLALSLPFSAAAVELELPEAATLAAERHEGLTSQKLAIGPYANGEIPAIWAEGARDMQVWRIDAGEQDSTLGFMAPLRNQIMAQGFDILFECRDLDCGGFDFRYAQEILPEPDMHVNLGDFRFLSAQRMTDAEPEYVALVISRNRTAGFVHLTSIGGTPLPEVVEPVAASTMNDPEEVLDLTPVVGLGDVLEAEGVAVLEDLEFVTGSSALSDGDYPSLEELAGYLLARPSMTVSLVGHTDAVGSMEANFRLSKARAASVRERLLSDFGVPSAQVDAQGVGYLAPLASNLSEDGRNLNRRVEVVLTATN